MGGTIVGKPNDKGVTAVYGKDYVKYKDIRDALNEQPDPVNSPSHYNSGGIEAIEAIEAALSSDGFRGYLKGNVMKYMWRYEKKAKPIEDFKKARWYLDRLIQKVEGA